MTETTENSVLYIGLYNKTHVHNEPVARSTWMTEVVVYFIETALLYHRCGLNSNIQDSHLANVGETRRNSQSPFTRCRRCRIVVRYDE